MSQTDLNNCTAVVFNGPHEPGSKDQVRLQPSDTVERPVPEACSILLSPPQTVRVSTNCITDSCAGGVQSSAKLANLTCALVQSQTAVVVVIVSHLFTGTHLAELRNMSATFAFRPGASSLAGQRFSANARIELARHRARSD